MTDGWGGSASEYERAVLSSLERSLESGSPGLIRRFDALGRDWIPTKTWVALALTWIAAALVIAGSATSGPLAFAGLGLMAGSLAFLAACIRSG